MMNSKQEEICSLNKVIEDADRNNRNLAEEMKGLEGTIRDVEEKNKRLVELLNSSMYNRAEQYKEKVLNKLQERGSTPNPN